MRALSGTAPRHLAAALLAAAALAAHSATASADVCTGGAPYQATGSAARIASAVPFLLAPRWSAEALPQWAETSASLAWGDTLAYAWYQDAALWGATSQAAWWVLPGLGCGVGTSHEAVIHEGVPYPPEICIVLYARLAFAGYDCSEPGALASAAAPVALRRGGLLLLAGFAPPADGSVRVAFAHGEATFPAAGGVYAGTAPAGYGAVLAASPLTPVAARVPAPVVIVDQTGLFSSSEGPLASTPRLDSLASQIHARLRTVEASVLGTAVHGRRAHDEVLYAPGSRPLAANVARAIHAAAPVALAGAALRTFGAVARVVVLAGRGD